MSDRPPRKRSFIKSVSVRFNKEVAPFQHVRVEVSSTVAKDDDPDLVREELTLYAGLVYIDIKNKIFVPPPIEEPL